MPPRLAAPLVIVVLSAGLVAGCGGSSVETEGTRIETSPGEVQLPESGGPPIGAGAESCDSDAVDAGSLRATNVSCDQARQAMDGWRRERSCSLPSGASRGGCLTRSYRCQSVRTDRGLAVSCSRAGASIAFLAKP